MSFEDITLEYKVYFELTQKPSSILTHVEVKISRSCISCVTAGIANMYIEAYLLKMLYLH